MTEAEKVSRALNGRKSGRGWICFCPVHDNSRTPALSVSSSSVGRLLVKCHTGCDGGAVIAELQRRGILDCKGAGQREYDPVEHRRRQRAELKREAQRVKVAHALFSAGKPCAGTAAQTYLESRGIVGARLSKMARTLRFHPAALHSPSGLHLPAMVAQIRGAKGEALGVHRTYLRPDGTGKADVSPAKMMLGPCAGGAVRFGPDQAVIALAEGIETSLSVALASRLTVWATLSTSGLKGLVLPPPPLAEVVIVAADHDEAGLCAAEETATRLEAEGRAVSVIHPRRPGTDFNDLLREDEK